MTHRQLTDGENGGRGITDPLEDPVPFTIDGQPFRTEETSQRASALLRLAGLDPAVYDLGELEGRDRSRTKRFDDDQVVLVTRGAIFVSIREKGDVA